MLKYGRLISLAKIVESFGIARGQFFHFVFVPKSLVYVLLGVVFMSCPHSVLECVEFAERDSFLYSPDANHHIKCFDIVGFVVLRVIHLFHIPYQIFCAKIEKPSAFHNGEGLERKTSQSFLSERQRCKYSEYEWKNKTLPVMLSRGSI